MAKLEFAYISDEKSDATLIANRYRRMGIPAQVLLFQKRAWQVYIDSEKRKTLEQSARNFVKAAFPQARSVVPTLDQGFMYVQVNTKTVYRLIKKPRGWAFAKA